MVGTLPQHSLSQLIPIAINNQDMGSNPASINNQDMGSSPVGINNQDMGNSPVDINNQDMGNNPVDINSPVGISRDNMERLPMGPRVL